MEPAVTCLVDGELRPADAPAVSALDPGLLGHGVYESIRTYDGRPFALDRHLERLAAGAAALDIDCPVAALARDVEEVARWRRGATETRIRIVLTAGGTRIVTADALPDRRRDRADGVTAVFLPWRRDPAGPTAGVKATSTAASRVAQRLVSARGAATGIWLTPTGDVSEALTANVFAVIGDIVTTPPLTDGPLAGVTRGELLRFAGEAGIPTAERSIPAGVLAAATEAFLSATSEPVVPLVRVGTGPIGDGAPGPVSRRLQELFEARARGG